jgi:hypothetical protein
MRAAWILVALVATAHADVAAPASAGWPPGVAPHGKLVRSLTWRDKAGENYAVFSTRDVQGHNPGQFGFCAEGECRNVSRYLSLEHYVVEKGHARLVRRVADKTENCDADLGDKFLLDTIQLTDLDGDGYQELTFAYFNDLCVTDMSPPLMKLVLLDKGAKYIVRHHITSTGDAVAAASELQVQRAEVAEQLAAWPVAFRAHGRAVWRTHELFPTSVQ